MPREIVTIELTDEEVLASLREGRTPNPSLDWTRLWVIVMREIDKKQDKLDV
jgi:hypothetical protein